MPQSFAKIYIHFVFHVKYASRKLREEHLERVHAYLGQLVNAAGCRVLKVGGVANHVHALFLLSREETIAHVVEEVKRNSSRWLKTLSPDYRGFAWQAGYAAFSVSQSMVDKTLAYIDNQAEHHKKLTFEEEYKTFLRLYGIDFDERYVLKD